MLKIASRSPAVPKSAEPVPAALATLIDAVEETQRAIAALAEEKKHKKILTADVQRDAAGKMTRVIITIQ
jgi:hypothetical protein